MDKNDTQWAYCHVRLAYTMSITGHADAGQKPGPSLWIWAPECGSNVKCSQSKLRLFSSRGRGMAMKFTIELNDCPVLIGRVQIFMQTTILSLMDV